MSWEDTFIFQNEHPKKKFYVACGNFTWIGMALDEMSAVTRAVELAGGPQSIRRRYRLGTQFYVSERGHEPHGTDTRIAVEGFISHNEESNQIP